MRSWDDILSPADREVIRRGGWDDERVRSCACVDAVSRNFDTAVMEDCV